MQTLIHFVIDQTTTHRLAFAGSCAVVGNAGHLRQSSLGAHIDAHDFVLRFNDAPTGSFPVDCLACTHSPTHTYLYTQLSHTITHTHTIPSNIHTRTHAHAFAHARTHTHSYTHARTHIYTRTQAHTFTRGYPHTLLFCSHTHARTYAHTGLSHTQFNRRSLSICDAHTCTRELYTYAYIYM